MNINQKKYDRAAQLQFACSWLGYPCVISKDRTMAAVRVKNQTIFAKIDLVESMLEANVCPPINDCWLEDNFNQYQDKHGV